LGGNVAVEFGSRNQAAPAHHDERQFPLAVLALKRAHGHTQFCGGFGEE